MSHRRLARRRRAREAAPLPSPRSHALLPLGALAAGFGLVPLTTLAQTAPTSPPAASAAAAARPASAPAAARPASAPVAAPRSDGTTLAPISVKAGAENDGNSFRATTTTVGRGTQDIRDVPQSTTILTEKLLEDRRADTVKDALHYTAGISFMAAEGGEEDIRLRGFSLTASGDIYADNVRDPAFYDRDVFNFDRIEVLRGSASMLFGRGSTGGVVNQVSKTPLLSDVHEVSASLGSGRYARFSGDFNFKLGERSALRLNAMTTDADDNGNGVGIDKFGIAPTFRWGIGTNDEFLLGYYYLENDNGVHYGLPWLRSRDGAAPISKDNPGVIVPVSSRNYYGAKSDYNAGYASYGTFRHTHRFEGGGGRLNTTVRQGRYDRDLRASTIRFCTRTATANLDCPATQPSAATLTGDQPLTLGTNNKRQDLHSTYVQTDYANLFQAFGMTHDVLGGVDLAREKFNNYAMTLPPGVTLNKNVPRSTLGDPGDGPSVDEDLRVKTLNRTFTAKAMGVYVQDLVEFLPTWKLLAGLRWDRFIGHYKSPATATAVETERSRGDSLWSKRAGLLWQPTEQQTYYVSYGTSFNTSGELYNYDAPGVKAPPEKSRNLEAGAKFELFEGRLSSRVAVFKSTKYNERNRDSPEGQPIADYILSGERHATGAELDLAGRITPAWEVFLSYAWIPSAKIDKAAFGVTPSGERVGDRPSLTPRHSGSLFTTYQVFEQLRVGGGLNGRSSQTPNRNPEGIVAPGFFTVDLFAEYAFTPQMSFKLNGLNVANKRYADTLYTGHYIPGVARTVYGTLTARF